MPFLSNDELEFFGFKKIGSNVKIINKASIYNPELIEIDDNSRIDDFCVLSGNIKIGKNVHIAVFNNIAGGDPGIYLDDFSGLAYGCHLFAQSDDYSGASLTNPTVPDNFKFEIKAPIHIGRHVIIGTASIVLPGVTIAEGCAIGAMSMVTKSTEAWYIYLGTPAKKIKARKKDLLKLEREYISSGNLE